MFIYNVTVTLEDSVEKEWLQWMREIHIPHVMQTGHFVDYKICKIVTEEKEKTFAVQYTFKIMSDLQQYQKDHAPRLQQDHTEKFKDKFAAFRTILEIVE